MWFKYCLRKHYINQLALLSSYKVIMEISQLELVPNQIGIAILDINNGQIMKVCDIIKSAYI